MKIGLERMGCSLEEEREKIAGMFSSLKNVVDLPEEEIPCALECILEKLDEEKNLLDVMSYLDRSVWGELSDEFEFMLTEAKSELLCKSLSGCWASSTAISSLVLGKIEIEKEGTEKTKESISNLTKKLEKKISERESKTIMRLYAQDSMSGLSKTLIEAAKDRSESLGQKGCSFSFHPSETNEILGCSKSGRVRRKVYERSIEPDRLSCRLTENLARKRRHLRMLEKKGGFDDASRMLGKESEVRDFLSCLSSAAKENISKWDEKMALLAKRANLKTVNPWDEGFILSAGNTDRATFGFLESLKTALDWVALNFGITFEESDASISGWKNARSWNAFSCGKMIGVVWIDPFLRQGKASGTWANSLISSSCSGKKKEVLISMSDFVLGTPWSKLKISRMGLSNLLHELGHAIHMLSISEKFGSEWNVPCDVQEVPAIFMERLAWDMDFLSKMRKRPWRPASGRLSSSDVLESLEESFFDLEMFGSQERSFVSARRMAESKVRNVKSRRVKSAFASVLSIVRGYDTLYYSYVLADAMVCQMVESCKKTGKNPCSILSSLFFGDGCVSGFRKRYEDLLGEKFSPDAMKVEMLKCSEEL